MKKIILTLILAFVFGFTFSQRITITTGMETLNGEFQKSYNLFVPHATAKSLSRAWSDFIKDHKGKVKTSGEEIMSMAVIVPMISKDTIQVFAKTSAVADGATLITGFVSPAGPITQESSPDASQAIMKLLHDLALPLAKEGLKDKVVLAQKALSVKEKENDDLVKRNERLKSDNEKMQSQIHDNQREIQDNQGKMQNLKNEISHNKEALDAVKAKEKDLD